jgi:hypothetical protein
METAFIRMFFPTLFRANCFNGTNVGTCAAISTKIAINNIDVSFGDCFYGAFIDASSAGSAFIRNYVSHIFSFLLILTAQM